MKQHVLQTPFGVHHTGTKEEMESLLNTIISQIGEYIPPTDEEIEGSEDYPKKKDYTKNGVLLTLMYKTIVEDYIESFRSKHLRQWNESVITIGNVTIGKKGELFARINKFAVLKNPEIRVNGETFFITTCEGHVTLAALTTARNKAFELLRLNTPVRECSVNGNSVEFRTNKPDLLSIKQAEEIVFGEVELPHTEELNKFLVKVAKYKIKQRYDNIISQASLLANLMKDE